jgi:hypothetical protein
LKGNSKITPIQPHFVAQNPSLAKQLFGYAILGFALTETIVLFALMMAFKKIYIYFKKIWCWYFGGNKYIFVAPYLQSKDSCTQKIYIFDFPNKMNISRLKDLYVRAFHWPPRAYT